MSMSIGMMCHSGFGGSARVAVELAHALVDRGHEVHLLARSRPPGAHSDRGLTVHTLDERPPSPVLDVDWTQDEIARFEELTRQVVLRHRIDLLHFHYALPFVWVTRSVTDALGSAAPPVVGTLHGTDVSILGHSPRREAVARELERVSLLTTVSRDHARLTRGGVRRRRPASSRTSSTSTCSVRAPRGPAGRASPTCRTSGRSSSPKRWRGSRAPLSTAPTASCGWSATAPGCRPLRPSCATSSRPAGSGAGGSAPTSRHCCRRPTRCW